MLKIYAITARHDLLLPCFYNNLYMLYDIRYCYLLQIYIEKCRMTLHLYVEYERNDKII